MGFQQTETSIGKSIAAGAIGGLVASLAMNQFQAAVSAVTAAMARRQGAGGAAPDQQQPREGSDEDTTIKTAEAISESVFQHKLSQDEKKWAAPLVHYGLGASLGAVYGALAERTAVERGAGTAYGTAVWLGADEIAVPLLGLSKSPLETPLSSHLNAWASHLVYGLVTHLTRKLVLS